MEVGLVETQDKTRYNVACLECDNVFTPIVGSPLWWRAKQRADKGLLDALYVDGEECGCRTEEVVVNPNAPFRVFGYDMLCENFDVPFDSMMEAIRMFIRLNQGPDVVFITGVSPAVMERLRQMR